MKIRTLFACLALGGIAVAGCAPSDSDEDALVQDTAASSAATATDGPTDAEIAHIVVTANSIDVAAGEVAKDKGTDREVVQFGERMIADHTGVNEQASQLAGRLNLTPAENATSQSLQTDADRVMQELQSKSGGEFDRAYIDREVAFHQQVLDAIDTTLLPGAQNAELRTLIEQTRPAIAAHLEMARGIQTRLNNK